MSKVPEVTVEDYKDWHRRYELKCKLPPDDKLQQGLSYANERAQKIEDKREQNREKVKLQSDKTPIYPIKYPAPEKEKAPVN